MIVLTAINTKSPEAQGLIERWTTTEDQFECALRGTVRGRFESLLARAMLRAQLDQYTSRKMWFFQKDSRGKLSVVNGFGENGPNICLAHTSSMVACALSSCGLIGIDVEAHRPRSFSKLAEFGFGVDERARVDELGAAEFYRIWTLREAMAKATGEGLTLATDRQDRIQSFSDDVWRQKMKNQEWLLGHICPASNVSLAIACLLDGEIGSLSPSIKPIISAENSFSQTWEIFSKVT